MQLVALCLLLAGVVPSSALQTVTDPVEAAVDASAAPDGDVLRAQAKELEDWKEEERARAAKIAAGRENDERQLAQMEAAMKEKARARRRAKQARAAAEETRQKKLEQVQASVEEGKKRQEAKAEVRKAGEEAIKERKEAASQRREEGEEEKKLRVEKERERQAEEAKAAEERLAEKAKRMEAESAVSEERSLQDHYGQEAEQLRDQAMWSPLEASQKVASVQALVGEGKLKRKDELFGVLLRMGKNGQFMKLTYDLEKKVCGRVAHFARLTGNTLKTLQGMDWNHTDDEDGATFKLLLLREYDNWWHNLKALSREIRDATEDIKAEGNMSKQIAGGLDGVTDMLVPALEPLRMLRSNLKDLNMSEACNEVPNTLSNIQPFYQSVALGRQTLDAAATGFGYTMNNTKLIMQTKNFVKIYLKMGYMTNLALEDASHKLFAGVGETMSRALGCDYSRGAATSPGIGGLALLLAASWSASLLLGLGH